MNAERWRQIDDLFQTALERPRDERTAFLRQTCEDDSELIREVRSLLAAHDRATPFLEAPAHGGAARLLDLDASASEDDPVGSRIGPYRIQKTIAIGGMGAVYLAVRDDDVYQKTVAIKLVRRSAMGSAGPRRAELLQRFQIERQVLATLDHPCIARLIDGGATSDGRPYFVMEHIEGAPIDQYCDRADLSIRQRVDLFLRVCDAVQHAHRNLVIHRDLKPGNIFVTKDGVPKLLDFGLAKLLDPHRKSATAAVTAAGEFMGTFAFAAPEQITDTGHEPDTRSDVYALGVVLHRLLTGRHPYDVSGPVSEVIGRITDEIPAPPSATNRAIDSDLDVIARTALAKEPARRYQSVGDLATDLARWRRGEPILARSDSGWYVLRKTVRRYRAPLALAALAIAVVAAFAVHASRQASRLADQRAALVESLRQSTIERARVIGMTGNMVVAEHLLWREHAAQPKDPQARWALWELYMNNPAERTIRSPPEDMRSSRLAAGRGNHVVANWQGRLAILNLATGRPIQLVSHDMARLSSFASSPDSSLLAIGDDSGRVMVMDLMTGDHRVDFNLDAPVAGVMWSGDGAMVGAWSRDAVTLWSMERGEPAATISIPASLITHAALNADASLLAVGGQDGVVRVIDATTGAALREFFEPGRRCEQVRFSPDGAYLAADVNGTSVAVIEVARLEVILLLKDSSGWVRTLEFHPSRANPHWLAAGGVDKSILIWEIPSGRIVRRLHAHVDTVQTLAFTSGGERLVSAGGGPLIRTWDLETTGFVSKWADAGSVFDVAPLARAGFVVTSSGDDDSAIRVRDARTGAILHQETGHTLATAAIAVSPDESCVVSVGYDRMIRRWRLTAQGALELEWSIPGHEELRESIAMISRTPQQGIVALSGIHAVTFSPEGDRIATSGDSGVVEIRDAKDGALLERLDFESRRIPSVDFTPEGDAIVIASDGPSRVTIHDLRSGERSSFDFGDASPRMTRFSPDGRLLAVAGDDQVIRIWERGVETLQGAPRTLEGHAQGLFALAFSPDGAVLASAGRSGVIKLWDPSTGRLLATLPKHDDMVFALEFAPTGHTLYSASRDETIGVWDLTYFDRHIDGNRAALSAIVRGAMDSPSGALSQ